jgi:hypothetical protein
MMPIPLLELDKFLMLLVQEFVIWLEEVVALSFPSKLDFFDSSFQSRQILSLS